MTNKTVLEPNKNTNLCIPPPPYQRVNAVSPAHNISYQIPNPMKSPSDQTLFSYSNNNNGRQ